MTDASVILVAEVAHPAVTVSSWSRGPFPWNVPRDPEGEIRARATYFHVRASDRLYGTHRRHRSPASSLKDASLPSELLDGVQLAGVEVLRLKSLGDGRPWWRSLLCLHLEVVAEDVVARLEMLTNLRPPGLSQPPGPLRPILEQAGFEPSPAPRAASIVFPHRPPTISTALPNGWTEHDLALFHLAAATTPERFPVAGESGPDLLSGRLRLSRTWEALVLRDGIAFGLLEQLEEEQRSLLAAYVRSIYLDAFLLGNAQRILLRELADDVARLPVPPRLGPELEDVERQHLEYAGGLAWQHVTHHGHATRVLVAYREQHRLAALAGEISKQVDRYGDHVRTRAAARSSAFLGVLAIVGLPFAILVPLARDFIGGWEGAAVAAAVALLILGALLDHPSVKRDVLAPLQEMFAQRRDR